MRIAEVAKLVERNITTLKRYEADGTIPAARRDFLGWRTYSAEDVETIRAILAGEEKQAIVV